MRKMFYLLLFCCLLAMGGLTAAPVSFTIKVQGGTPGSASYWLVDTTNNQYCGQLQPQAWNNATTGGQTLTLPNYTSGDILVLSSSPFVLTNVATFTGYSQSGIYDYTWGSNQVTPDKPIPPAPLSVSTINLTTAFNTPTTCNLTLGVSGGIKPYTFDSFSLIPNAGTYSFNAQTNELQYSPSNTFSGTATITYWVHDSSGASKADSVVVVVANPTPLVVNNYTWNVTSSETQEASLNLTSNVIAGGVSPYTVTVQNTTLPTSSWSLNGTTLTLLNTSTVGSYTVSISVKDSKGTTASGTLYVSIQKQSHTLKLVFDNSCIQTWGTGGGCNITLVDPSTTYSVATWTGSLILPSGYSISGENVINTPQADGSTLVTITPPSWGSSIPVGGKSTAQYISMTAKDWTTMTQLLDNAFIGTLLMPPDPTSVTLPSQVFAPYFDTGCWNPSLILSDWMNNYNFKFVTLAFIVAGSNKQPVWDGQDTEGMNSYFFSDQIEKIRDNGGDVIVSFGGANGTMLASAITNVPDLVKAYESVINSYNLNNIDFDIEGSIATTDCNAIIRRSQALAIIQKEYPNINISYTLQVAPTGLTSYGINIVQQAINAGVKLSTINLMTMDYGGYFDAMPKYNYNMVTMTEDAINNTETQLKQLYPSKTDSQIYAMIGMTPMIGINDDTSEIVSVSNAQTLAQFAKQKGLARVSFWRINNDNSASSGVSQNTGAFTQTFDIF